MSPSPLNFGQIIFRWILLSFCYFIRLFGCWIQLKLYLIFYHALPVKESEHFLVVPVGICSDLLLCVKGSIYCGTLGAVFGESIYILREIYAFLFDEKALNYNGWNSNFHSICLCSHMQASQRGIFLQLDGVFLLAQRDLLLVIQSFLFGK